MLKFLSCKESCRSSPDQHFYYKYFSKYVLLKRDHQNSQVSQVAPDMNGLLPIWVANTTRNNGPHQLAVNI